MSYRGNVEQAAAALKRGEDANWELARLTFENTFNSGNYAVQPDRVRMAQWCADVREASGRRFSDGHAARYKRIWALFGIAKDGQPFSVAERGSWSDAYEKVSGETAEEVRDRLRVAGVSSGSPEVKRATFQQLARDPDVIQEAANIGSPTSRAVTEIVQRRETVQAEQRERVIDTDPIARTLDRQRAALDIEGFCLRFERDCTRFAREISETLPRTGEASEQHLLWVRGTIERARSVMSQLETYVENGQTDIDAFLQDVLAGGTRG